MAVPLRVMKLKQCAFFQALPLQNQFGSAEGSSKKLENQTGQPPYGERGEKQFEKLENSTCTRSTTPRARFNHGSFKNFSTRPNCFPSRLGSKWTNINPPRF